MSLNPGGSRLVAEDTNVLARQPLRSRSGASGAGDCRLAVPFDSLAVASQRKYPNRTVWVFSLVIPAGVEPAIFWMRTRRPGPLDDGTSSKRTALARFACRQKLRPKPTLLLSKFQTATLLLRFKILGVALFLREQNEPAYLTTSVRFGLGTEADPESSSG